MYGQTIKDYAMLPLHESLMDALRIMSGEEVVQHSFDLYENEWEDESQENNPRHSYYLNGKVEWKSLKQETINISGRLLGGCLDSIKFYVGTKYDEVDSFNERYKNDGVIWFIEACDLNVMSIRRALWNLDRAGWFKYTKGFIIGRPLAAWKQEMMGLDQYNAVTGILGKYNVPIVMDADVGHLAPAVPVLSGAFTTVTADSNINLKYKL